MRRIGLAVVLAAVIVGSGVIQLRDGGGVSSGSAPEPHRLSVTPVVPASPPSRSTDAAGQLDALEVLATLTVAPPHLGAPGYVRDDWPVWLDLDGDGCSAREEVLLTEAVAPVPQDQCVPSVATWQSSYDDRELTDPSDIDVDHVVALAEVHRSGGWAWAPAAREAYANDVEDPRTLAAVSGSANRSKGDRDPAGWLPEHGVCTYIGDWIAVKARWRLTVDAEEATVLSDLLLAQCRGAAIEPWTDPVALPR